MKRSTLVSGLILMMGFGWMSGHLVWAGQDQPLPKDALSPTPPMGWNAWYCFGPNIDQEKIMGIADAMVSSGMKEAGYQYIALDEGWELGRVKGFEFIKVQEVPGRDENGVILVDPKKFPQGLKFLSDYIHAKGLKFGIYTGPGKATCGNYTASGGFEQSDINTFVNWGVDLIKLDWCVCSKGPEEVLPLWRTLLDECGRPIFFSVNSGGDYNYVKTVANMWRTASDLRMNWIWKKGEYRLMISVVDAIDTQVGLDKFHGPGHWCDPDMLHVGNGNLTEEENHSHFSMWCLLAAPLMASTDLRSMSESTRTILTNREVIAVDQDPAGQMGKRVRIIKPGLEVWAKRLQPFAAQAVVLLNRTEQAQEITVDLADLGIKGSAFVRDLWLHQDLGLVTKSFSANVPSHGCVMVKMHAFETLGSYPEPEDVTTVNKGICLAEQANVEGGMMDDKNAGFTGTGYAMAQVHEWRTFYMKWVVYCRQDRMCKAQIRYANGDSKDTPFSISVPVPSKWSQNFTASPTGSWETWKTIEFQIPLKKGYNHIDLGVAKPDLNNLAVDYLKISPV